jgi:hypothetical protein
LRGINETHAMPRVAFSLLQLLFGPISALSGGKHRAPRSSGELSNRFLAAVATICAIASRGSIVERLALLAWSDMTKCVALEVGVGKLLRPCHPKFSIDASEER